MVVDVLLVRRCGLTCAVRREDVVAIARRGRGAEVRMRAGALPVEAVLGVQRDLPVRGAGPTLRRLLPPACLGLAVVAGEPVAFLNSSLAIIDATPAEGGSRHGT